MSAHHRRSTGRFTPSAKFRQAERPDVHLVRSTTPGFISAGKYTMLFDCTTELCSCSTATHTAQEQTKVLGDVAVIEDGKFFSASKAAGGPQPFIDVFTGAVMVTLGHDETIDIVTWEWELVHDLLDEVFAVPAQGCVLAVGRPEMAGFVLLTHEAARALARFLLIQSELRPGVMWMEWAAQQEDAGLPFWK